MTPFSVFSGRSAGLRSVLRRVTTPVVVVPASLFLLIEDLVWDTISALVARVASWRWVARLEARLRLLHPYAALGLFLVPVLLVLPFKLLGVYLITQGHALSGIATIVGAKLVGTVVLTRLFVATRSQLMRVAWFAAFYYWLIRTRQALYEQLHGFKLWIWVATLVSAIRRRLRIALADTLAMTNLLRANWLLTLARLRAARRMLDRSHPHPTTAPGAGE